MKTKYFLAIDIGASSGRHILGSVDNGVLTLEEVYRFKNGAVEKGGKLIWDTGSLFQSILEGLKKCKEIGKIPCSVGIDTWGVDYALLDENDNLINEVYSYRDQRTLAIMDELHSIISEDVLYERTGIAKQVYNTIYQLYEDKKSGKMQKAKTMLFVPDYLHFLLTGKKTNEYTIASTSGLINSKDKTWDYEIIEKLGLKKELFNTLSLAGTDLGVVKPEIAKEIGYETTVCIPCCHDTGSADLAVPNANGPLYISSGTWSLMGLETETAITSKLAKEQGFTNEGGYAKTVRFLQNIMGLWMIQSVKKEIGQGYSFGEICEMASNADISSIVDVNDGRFLAPSDMTEEVKTACADSGMQVPKELAEVAAVIYNSLAHCYGQTVSELEMLTGKTFDGIHIVGGGANAEYLNALTAKATGKTVYAGPTEATAIGNLAVQMIAEGELENLREARDCIYRSFEIKKYEAEDRV